MLCGEFVNLNGQSEERRLKRGDLVVFGIDESQQREERVIELGLVLDYSFQLSDETINLPFLQVLFPTHGILICREEDLTKV